MNASEYKKITTLQFKGETGSDGCEVVSRQNTLDICGGWVARYTR